MDSYSDALYQAASRDLEKVLGVRPNDSANAAAAVDWRTFDGAPRTAAAHSLLLSLLKKYQPRTRDVSRSVKAISLFLDCNKSCGEVELTDASLVREMAHIAFRELGELPTWSELLERANPGPGASVGSRGRNSYLEKTFINSLTTTSPALYSEWWKFSLRRTNWWLAELRRIQIQNGDPYELVAASSLSTVPKNSDIDRTICTEPSLNMFFQKSIGDYLESVLTRVYGYSSAEQPERNRRLAKRGSLDGSIATIDLSSASDTISMKLVEAILPSDWFAAICDCRSQQTKIDATLVQLNMVSSMGNGFTFPLETYIFSLMCKALARLHNIPFDRFNEEKRYGVFGDDLVVPTELYELCLSGLTSLGFTPNKEKSFNSGHFRESCGTDWFMGVDIRGVYIKHHRGVFDRFSAINTLNRWSAKHRIPLERTIQFLLPRSWRHHAVPTDESDTAGIKCPLFLLEKRTLKYTALKPRIKLVRFVNRKGNLKRAFNNPLGLLLAASIGAARSEGISRRSDMPRYTQVLSHSPYWDREGDLSRHGVSISDWRKYCWLNLTES